MAILTSNVLTVRDLIIIISNYLQAIGKQYYFPYFSNHSDECRVDRDCPLSKACVANECIDPCKDIRCGTRAECKVNSHRATCFCPAGLQGNPLVACTEVGCRASSECADNEKCQNRECKRLCQSPTCANGAICSARNHQEICTCDPPLQGDGYSYCYKPQRKTNICC